jgi:hypothetical protein
MKQKKLPQVHVELISEIMKVFMLPNRARILAYMSLYPDKAFRTSDLVQVWPDVEEAEITRNLSFAAKAGVIIIEDQSFCGIQGYFRVYKINNSEIYKFILDDIFKWLQNCPEIMADINYYIKRTDEAKNKGTVDVPHMFF